MIQKIKRIVKGTSLLPRGERGAVLIAVSVLSLVMMILALGIISLGTSQGISNQHQVERIKAEELARGAWSFEYSNRIAGTSATWGSQTLDGKTYSIEINPPIADTGPYQTDTYIIRVEY